MENVRSKYDNMPIEKISGMLSNSLVPDEEVRIAAGVLREKEEKDTNSPRSTSDETYSDLLASSPSDQKVSLHDCGSITTRCWPAKVGSIGGIFAVIVGTGALYLGSFRSDKRGFLIGGTLVLLSGLAGWLGASGIKDTKNQTAPVIYMIGGSALISLANCTFLKYDTVFISSILLFVAGISAIGWIKRHQKMENNS